MSLTTIRLALPVLALPVVVACQADFKREYKEAVRLAAKDDFASLNEAIDRYDRSIRYSLLALDGKAEALKALGLKLLEHRMYEKAAAAFRRARSIAPSDSNLHYYLGLCYANAAELASGSGEAKKKLLDRAESAYAVALNIDPENTIAHYAMGVLLGFGKGDLKGGLASLEVAAEQEPRSIEVRFALANLYHQSDRSGDAAGQYRAVLELTAKDSRQHQKALENLEQLRKGL